MYKFRNIHSENKFRYVHKYGIIYFKNNLASSSTSSTDIRIYGELFFLDAIYAIFAF